MSGLGRCAIALAAAACVITSAPPVGLAQTEPSIVPQVQLPTPLESSPTQVPPERRAVGQRIRPEFEEPGILYGGFLFKPAIDLGERFDTNIFGSRSGASSDFITSIIPEFHAA